MGRCISFEKDIRPLFKPQDITCMKSVNNLAGAFDLSNYKDVRSYASKIYNMLTLEGSEYRMPMGGPYWSDENIALFREWVAADCPP